MKITIINLDRNEKRYTRVDLDEFVTQLRDGTYRQQYIRDFNKDVCPYHAAERAVSAGRQLRADDYPNLPGTRRDIRGCRLRISPVDYEATRETVPYLYDHERN